MKRKRFEIISLGIITVVGVVFIVVGLSHNVSTLTGVGIVLVVACGINFGRAINKKEEQNVRKRT